MIKNPPELISVSDRDCLHVLLLATVYMFSCLRLKFFIVTDQNHGNRPSIFCDFWTPQRYS